MVTFLIFIAVLGVLVLVHEWGHFVMARRAGMKVEEFGFGFPPRLFGIQKINNMWGVIMGNKLPALHTLGKPYEDPFVRKEIPGDTVYSINLIPFGGFVKILGEDGDSRDDPTSFGSKPISARLGVVVAGVVMNLLLAVLLLILGNFFGLRIGLFDEELIAVARDKKIQIIQVVQGSPAEKAGLKVLDEITGFDVGGEEIFQTATIEEVQKFTNDRRGQKLNVVIRHGKELRTITVEVRANPPPGEGSMGISMALTGVVSYPWYEAVWRGGYDTYILAYNTIYGYGILLKTLLFEQKLIAEVSGPIGIAGITGQAARVGFSYLMQFVALISINLAVLNIVPFPALDGGRALFLLIEKIKGAPINRRAEAALNGAGFALLITLMIYVTIKDIAKFFIV